MLCFHQLVSWARARTPEQVRLLTLKHRAFDQGEGPYCVGPNIITNYPSENTRLIWSPQDEALMAMGFERFYTDPMVPNEQEPRKLSSQPPVPGVGGVCGTVIPLGTRVLLAKNC